MAEPGAASRCPACGAAAGGAGGTCGRCAAGLAHPGVGRALAPLPRGAVAAFVAGAETFAAGLGTIRGDRVLKRLAAAPAIVNLAILVLLVAAVIEFRPVIADLVLPDATGVVAVLAFIGSLAAAAVSALLLHPILVSVASAPFNEALSARVERLVRSGWEGESEGFALSRAAIDVLRPIGQSLRVAGYRLAAAIVLVPLSLVPVAGPIAVFLVSAAFTAYDWVELPAARVRMSYREKRALLRRHRAASLGFGSAAQFLLLVPFVNVLALPVAVAGGTLLFFRMEK